MAGSLPVKQEIDGPKVEPSREIALEWPQRIGWSKSKRRVKEMGNKNSDKEKSQHGRLQCPLSGTLSQQKG